MPKSKQITKTHHSKTFTMSEIYKLLGIPDHATLQIVERNNFAPYTFRRDARYQVEAKIDCTWVEVDPDSHLESE